MTTVRLYFRNITLFVHHAEGTDVWFMASHQAHVFTRERLVPLKGTVIRITSQGKPLEGRGKLSINCPRVISFNTLAPGGVPNEAIKNRKLSPHLIARLELPLAGTLRDQPSGHSYGVLLDWRTPVMGATEFHIQRLTEVAVYEVEEVADPGLLIEPHGGPAQHLELRPSGGEPGVADAFFVSGELPKKGSRMGVREHKDRGELRIEEFEAFHNCFDAKTKSLLAESDVIPVADSPEDRVFFMTAEPFCPTAQLDLRESRKL